MTDPGEQIPDGTQAATPHEPGAETASEGEPEVAALRAALAERDTLLDEERASARQLIERLRTALLASDPDVEPDLVVGETLEDVETSFAQAQELARRMRERVAREAAIAIPAGAPGRAQFAPVTAFDKIRAGLAGR